MSFRISKLNDWMLFLKMNNQNKQHNQKIRRNNQIFALLMIVTQIGFSVIYGIFYSIDAAALNVSAILNVIALAILVVAGFGLVISNLKRLMWSGLGFTLFITALSIQFYPLINNFWAKTHIKFTITPSNWGETGAKVFLSNSGQAYGKFYGNCISNALKCALAVTTAFSSILGRAGALQCWFVTIIGTIGFELNRLVILNISNDTFGTYFIFTYGGFMGLALGLILNIFKEKLENGSSTSRNGFNNAHFFSSTLSLFGSLIIFTLFPCLAYNIENTNNFNTFSLYMSPTSVLMGMGASLVGSFLVSSIYNQNIIIRDIVHAPIAGGIVVGSASSYITNPVYALVAGMTAGSIQAFIQNQIQKPYIRDRSVVSTISWSLFGVQGLIGGAFASGFQRIIQSNSNGFIYQFQTIKGSPGHQMLAAVISAGIGFGIGLITGLIILLFSNQKGTQHFIDRTYWVNDDGITLKQIKIQKLQKSIKLPQKQKPQIQKVEEEGVQNEQVLKSSKFKIEYSEVVPSDLSTPNFEMSFSDADKLEKKHVYL